MKFKIGALYELVFWDHSSTDSPEKFITVGYVEKDLDKYVVLNTWVPLGYDESNENYKENSEMFSIMKSCIISRKKLQSGREKVKG